MNNLSHWIPLQMKKGITMVECIVEWWELHRRHYRLSSFHVIYLMIFVNCKVTYLLCMFSSVILLLYNSLLYISFALSCAFMLLSLGRTAICQLSEDNHKSNQKRRNFWWGRKEWSSYKGEQRWTLVEPWCKHWSCCGWQKGTLVMESISQ